MRSRQSVEGAPLLLWQEDGRWCLEVVEHADAGHNVVRPTSRTLRGRRAIAAYFERQPERAQLARATWQLMQAEDPPSSQSYSAIGGAWLCNSAPPLPNAQERGSPALEQRLHERVDYLQVGLLALQAWTEGLIQRVAQVETQGEELRQLRESVTAHAAELPRLNALIEELCQRALEPPDPPDALQPALAPSAELAVAPQAVPPGAGPAERTPLALPGLPELSRCMAQLVPGSAPHAPGSAVDPRRLGECWGTPLLTDRGEEVGAILLDLRATVFLGGTLMLLPRAELENQVRRLTPAEDSIGASAEVCNALAGVINGAQPEHVSIGKFASFDLKAAAWLDEPVDRRELEDGFGGRVLLLSRRRPIS